jgi:hypothetical protein
MFVKPAVLPFNCRTKQTIPSIRLFLPATLYAMHVPKKITFIGKLRAAENKEARGRLSF